MLVLYKDVKRAGTGKMRWLSKLCRLGARGVGLLEVLIAVIILGIGFLGTGKLVAVFVKKNSDVTRATTATTLIQDKIEEFKRMRETNFDGITSGSDGGTITSQEGAGGAYTRTWTVTTSGSLKTIVVTVSWLSSGQTVSKSMMTAISQ